jgi:AraC-like DNA-binding protein
MGRTFYRSLLTAISLTIMPLAGIAVILSLIANNTFAKNYMQLNIKMMGELCLYIDENLARSMDTAQYLSNNSALKRLIANIDSTQAETADALRAIAEHTRFIDPLRAFNPIMGVYMPTRDFLVIGGVTNRNSGVFYDNSFQFSGLSSEEFYGMVQSTDTMRYIPPLYSGSPYLHNEPHICYVQNISMGYISRHVFLLTLINSNDIESLIMSRLPAGSFFSIYSLDGSLLMSPSENADVVDIRALAQETWKTSIGGESYVASFHELDKTKLSFVLYIPETFVMQSITKFQSILLAVILAIAAIGILASVLLMRRQYAPLSRLLRQIFPDGASLKNNEYIMISRRVEETRQQNEQFMAEIKQQSERIANDTLLSLLTLSHTMSGPDIDTLLKMCNLSFSEPRFHVLFVKNCACAEAFGGAAAVCRLSSLDIALIVNDNPEKRDLLAELQSTLASLCGRHPQILVGISGATDRIGSLSACFHEATVAVNAASVKSHADDNALITFERATQASNSIYYPIDKETQVMAALHESNYEACELLLAEIKHENENKRRVSSEMMYFLYHAFISTAYRVYDALQLEDKAPLSTALKALGPSADNNMLFADILDMYRLTCDLIRKNHEMKDLRFINHVVRYIQEHSSSPSLSMDVIAKRFGVSYYYLSHLFNEAVGQSFTDILNKSRIKQAMLLLGETNDTVQNIAEIAGFTNLNTFLRAFRKETGTTPSKYRAFSRRAADLPT